MRYFLRSLLVLTCVSALGACAASSGGGSGGSGFAGSAGVGGVGGSSGVGGVGATSGNGGVGGVSGVGGVGGNAGFGGNAGDNGNREPLAIDETGSNNPAGATPEQVAQLTAGGPPNSMKFLYPYSGTVFPRGILPPEIMWDGAGDTLYLHVHSQLFDYKGVLTPTMPGTIELPQNVWDGMGAQTLGKNDPFTIELTTMTGGTVSGPISQQVIVAQATLKGSIYYNSYSSPLASAGIPSPAGAVLRIPPGRTAEVFVGGSGVLTCNGCHSVSANGARLITGGLVGGAYSITSGQTMATLLTSTSPGGEFSGLSPDGSIYITSAHPNGVGPRSTGTATADAETHVTADGSLIADTGIPLGAMMPTFSPDGRMITFSDYALGDGHGVAVMNFDATTRKATGYTEVYTDPSRYAGWPFLLPDNRAVVFALGQSPDFSGFGAGLIPGAVGMPSDLYIGDANTKSTTVLAQAMGFNTPSDYTSNTTYLIGGADDLHQNYYPTVSPVAAGGYFWIFFDTVRTYGNRGLVRQLWGTAVTISGDGTYDSDPSHPAFYLPGQEFGTGNHRAFTALDPCRADGQGCETGIDCCSGFCTDGMCLTPPVTRCAETSEGCATGADCCSEFDQCFGGFCSVVLPPE